MYVFDFFKIYMYMIYKNEFIKNLIDILKFYFFFERNFFIIEFGYGLQEWKIIFYIFCCGDSNILKVGLMGFGCWYSDVMDKVFESYSKCIVFFWYI